MILIGVSSGVSMITENKITTREEDANTGWSEFFTHVASFLSTCERQYGLANENFTEYVIEHVNMLLQCVVSILEIIDQTNSSTLRQVKIHVDGDSLNVVLNL